MCTSRGLRPKAVCTVKTSLLLSCYCAKICNSLRTLLAPLLHNIALRVILFVPLHKKGAAVNVNTDHTEVLAAGARSGAWWEGAVLRRRMERKLSNVSQVFEKIVGDD